MILDTSVLLWSNENCRSWSMSGSLRKPARVHGLHSAPTISQRLDISVLSGVDTAVDAKDESDGVGSGEGVRGRGRNLIPRKDRGGDSALAGGGDGDGNLGTELTILRGAHEVT